MNREILKGHLPVLILGLLAARPMHGYAICRELESGDHGGGGALGLGEGTVYPVLHRLERQGHLEARWQRDPVTGKRRKLYAVTDSGLREIARHQAEWQSLAALFNQILGKGWTTP